MGLSDTIARFIKDIMENEDGCCELKRRELASKFNCVPSQINYVISTRFSPEHGYIVESRRGGGGYIRIRQVCLDPRQLAMHIVNAIGEEIDGHAARIIITNLEGHRVISPQEAELMLAAAGDNALRTLAQPQKDQVRAGILKQMLSHIMGQNMKGVE